MRDTYVDEVVDWTKPDMRKNRKKEREREREREGKNCS